MGFLTTILLILLIYYLLKILVRWFAPKLFSYAARKTEEHIRERFEGFEYQNTSHRQEEGEVIITNKKRTNKNSSSDKVGEYIDFEEIE